MGAGTLLPMGGSRAEVYSAGDAPRSRVAHTVHTDVLEGPIMRPIADPRGDPDAKANSASSADSTVIVLVPQLLQTSIDRRTRADGETGEVGMATGADTAPDIDRSVGLDSDWPRYS